MQRPGAPEHLPVDGASLPKLWKLILSIELHKIFDINFIGRGGQAAVCVAVLRAAANPEVLAGPLAEAVGISESRMEYFLRNELQSSVMKLFHPHQQPDPYQVQLTAELISSPAALSTSWWSSCCKG